jgi:hypothetical protein
MGAVNRSLADGSFIAMHPRCRESQLLKGLIRRRSDRAYDSRPPQEHMKQGGVEGEGGYFRRNHLVPVPEAKSLEAFNQEKAR